MISNFKKNKKENLLKYFLLYLGGILILFIVVFLIIANIKIYHKRKEFLSQVENLKNQVKDIQNKNNNLKQGILKADDNQYIEKVAREELDLQKKGEKTVSFIMPQIPKKKVNNEQQNIVQVWLGWLGNSWNWIKSNF